MLRSFVVWSEQGGKTFSRLAVSVLQAKRKIRVMANWHTSNDALFEGCFLGMNDAHTGMKIREDVS